MKTGFIYRVFKKDDNKSYIGLTFKANPFDRVRDHLFTRFSGNPLIFSDIEEFGLDAFDWEILHSNVPKDQIYELEIKCIKEWNTYEGFGYNRSPGGSGWEHTEESKKQISDKIKEYIRINGHNSIGLKWTCLLYTSPSPRD